MSINIGEIITNIDELEEGKDYLIQFCYPYYKEYNGIYTYTKRYNITEFGYDRTKQQILVFINLIHEIRTTSDNWGYYSNIFNGFVGTVININNNEYKYPIPKFVAFEILTNEYVLK
jgi:hypothetical protein